MKNLLTAAAVAAAIALGGTSAQAEGDLHIFIWGDYTSPQAIKKFEETYKVKVTMDNYDSNDQMLAKVKAGGSGYDIVVPSSYVVPSMISDGLLAKTEPGQMSNAKYLRPEFVHVYWDDGHHYSVPWQWGTTALTVNTDLYKGPHDSWSLIFNPPEELKGKINVVPEMVDVMNATSFYLGLPVCSDNKEDLKKISDTLINAKQYWRTMDYGVIEKMVSKDVTVTMNWNGSSFRARLQVPAITYVYPKEGLASWMDNVVVLKDAPNLENAKLFQNFIMEPEVAAMLSTFARYDNGIQSADFMPADMKTAPEIVPPAGFKANFVPACSQAVMEIYGKIWNKLLK
jgi:spermidine/putrescine transport system substrate-binding protein